MDNLNQLSSGSRSGSFTVAGVASEPRGGDGGWGYPAGVSNVVVSGTGLSSGNADIYTDGAWARTNATLADGNNTYNATASDTYGRTASDSVTVNLPATPSFQYDGNGNLTNDGRRVLEYDFENQLTNVYVASGWRSEFRYDAFGRQRVRREYTWSSGAWLLTNEVRLVYDGMLVVQERDANNLAQVSYTRGNDLSGSLQGAGGIGGLLARTDMPSTINPQPSTSPHAYYHCDGNGNVTALVSTNGIMLARYSYDPYGNLLGLSGPLAEANRYRFSSKEWNGNAGVYYYGYRFYDGGLQRWLNRDPIGAWGGMNLFQFVGNAPPIKGDPFGLDQIGCTLEGEFGYLLGLDVGISIVYDTENSRNSGIYTSCGPAFPALTLGAGCGVVYAPDGVAGETINADLNLGAISPTVSIDTANNFSQIAITFGPGVGGAISNTQTDPLVTWGDVVDRLRDLLNSLFPRWVPRPICNQK